MVIDPQDIEETQTHIMGEFDFDFSDKNTLCSVGKDRMFKKRNLQNFELSEEEIEDKEPSVIAINPKKQTEMVVADEQQLWKINNDEFDIGYPNGDGIGNIQIVKYSPDGKCAAFTQNSNVVKMVELENDRIFLLKNQESMALNLAFSDDNKYLAISAQDGYVYIYRVADINSIVFEKKILAGKEVKGSTYQDTQKLQILWKSNSHQLFLSGSNSLQFACESDGWNVQNYQNIMHKSEISLITQVAKDKVVTVDVNGHMILSNFEKSEILYEHKFSLYLVKMIYSQDNQILIFSDSENNLSFWKKFNVQSIEQQEQEKQKQQQQIQKQYQEQQKNEKMELEQEQQQQELKQPQKQQQQTFNNSVDYETELNKNLNSLNENQNTPQQQQEPKKNEVPLTKEQKMKLLEQEVKRKKQQKNDLENPENNTVQQDNLQQLNPEALQQLPNAPVYSKKMQQRIDQMIGTVQPQDILYSTSTQYENNAKFLVNNYIGSIISRKPEVYIENAVEGQKQDNQMLEFEFADKGFHQNLFIKDNYYISMACMNLVGAFMASKIAETYDEEELDIEVGEEKSVLIFKHFKPIFEKNEWIISLEDQESPDAVAMGNDWCCAATNQYNLRVFSISGIQRYCIKFGKPLVSLCGYENLLVMVYHDGVPIFGCQNIKMNIYDVSQKMRLIDQNSINLGESKILSYIGFSESGLLIMQDNNSNIFAYINQEWHQIEYEQRAGKKLWCTGMVDDKILGIKISETSQYPHTYPKKDMECVQVVSNLQEEENSDYNKIQIKKLLLEHERYRNRMWMKYKIAREQTQILYKYSNSILDEDDLKKKSDEIDKDLVFFFKKCLENSQLEKAFQIATQEIESINMLKKCLILCQKLNITQSYTDLLQLNIEEKLQVQRFERSIQSTQVKSNIGQFQQQQKLNNGINNYQAQLQQVSCGMNNLTTNNNDNNKQLKRDFQTHNNNNNNQNNNIQQQQLQNKNNSVEPSPQKMLVEQQQPQMNQVLDNPFSKKLQSSGNKNGDCLFGELDNKKKAKKLELFN